MTNVTEQAVSPLQLAGLKKKWNWFFFESADPANCAIIRIGYSALLLLMLLVQWPDAAFWYSDSGVLPLSASRKLIDSDTLTVLAWLPTDASTIQLCYGLFILQAVMLLVGFKSRLQAVCLLVWLTSFHHRNGLLLDGEDTVFRIFAFLLAFSPCSRSSWLNCLVFELYRVKQKSAGELSQSCTWRFSKSWKLLIDTKSKLSKPHSRRAVPAV